MRCHCSHNNWCCGASAGLGCVPECPEQPPEVKLLCNLWNHWYSWKRSWLFGRRWNSIPLVSKLDFESQVAGGRWDCVEEPLTSCHLSCSSNKTLVGGDTQDKTTCLRRYWCTQSCNVRGQAALPCVALVESGLSTTADAPVIAHPPSLLSTTFWAPVIAHPHSLAPHFGLFLNLGVEFESISPSFFSLHCTLSWILDWIWLFGRNISFCPLDCGPNALEDEQGDCKCQLGFTGDGSDCFSDRDLMIIFAMMDKAHLSWFTYWGYFPTGTLMGFLTQRTIARRRPIQARRTRMKMEKETGVAFLSSLASTCKSTVVT